MLLLHWTLLGGILQVAAKGQAVFNPGTPTSLNALRAVSTTEHTTLVHPAYPRHAIRIKQNSQNFCDDTVRSYTGYLDISETHHLFFYFFESRNDPDTDDVILWTNGGPGCSSSLGLFMELGPCQIRDASGPSFNPHSWNANANIFFIDQPVGVGFSYAEYGESIGTTEDAAKDIAAFVNIFFQTFSDFEGRPFHLAGESYGGRYLPVFAAEIFDENKRAIAAGNTPINLASVMIGNGITDFKNTILSYYDIQCTGASIDPFQDISTCVRMKQALPRCRRQLEDSCVDRFDAMGCGAAAAFCYSEFAVPFSNTGKNPYDVSKDCEGDIAETLCYPMTRHIIDFLNKPEIRDSLGVDASLGNFSTCSDKVGADFALNLDEFTHQTQFYVAELLQRGIRVLVYVGSYDWICNWVGNERFTLDLEWPGRAAFGSEKLREWEVDGEAAGLTRSYGGLTFATVEAAGHMVPYDKPAQALALVKRWLAQEEL